MKFYLIFFLGPLTNFPKFVTTFLIIIWLIIFQYFFRTPNFSDFENFIQNFKICLKFLKYLKFYQIDLKYFQNCLYSWFWLQIFPKLFIFVVLIIIWLIIFQYFFRTHNFSNFENFIQNFKIFLKFLKYSKFYQIDLKYFQNCLYSW